MADGKLVINKAGKYLSKLDKLTRIDKYVKQGKSFTRLSTSGGLKQFTDLGDSLLDKLKLVDKNVVLKGSKQAFKEAIKGIGKGTLKRAGNALKKSVSFGINGVVKDAKTLINAKGAGKIVPELNIALGAVVGVGIIAGWIANTIDKKLGVTSEMKKGVNSLIKSARGWFS